MFLIRLNSRSTFVPEALEILVEEPDQPAGGTGPFGIVSSSSDGLEMAANRQYYLGAPHIDRIVFKPYPSSRAAWADMMRGQVDVLYDVAPDALDLLRPSSNVHVFEFRERYTYAILLNMRRPLFKDKRLRAALNARDRPRQAHRRRLSGARCSGSRTSLARALGVRPKSADISIMTPGPPERHLLPATAITRNSGTNRAISASPAFLLTRRKSALRSSVQQQLACVRR